LDAVMAWEAWGEVGDSEVEGSEVEGLDAVMARDGSGVEGSEREAWETRPRTGGPVEEDLEVVMA